MQDLFDDGVDLDDGPGGGDGFGVGLGRLVDEGVANGGGSFASNCCSCHAINPVAVMAAIPARTTVGLVMTRNLAISVQDWNLKGSFLVRFCNERSVGL